MKSIIFLNQNKRVRVRGLQVGNKLWLHVNGETWVIEQNTNKKLKSGKGHQETDDNEILAPMPGKILRIMTRMGDLVKKDQVLLVMEAMKMEYSLTAPCAGQIELVDAMEAQQVELGRLLIRIKKTSEDRDERKN